MEFQSRRSVVVCKHGCVASSDPLASQVGLDILKAGGNAADAAVAVAAMLNVTEPMSCGIGGDAFCLFYDSATKTVKGLNGSGRAAAASTLEHINSVGFNKDHPIPGNHGLAVTVPGAAAAWVDTVEHFGSHKLSMLEILTPAIEQAKSGFPVQEIASTFWEIGSTVLNDPSNLYGGDMLLNGRAPQHGEIMTNPHLATTFKELACHGKKGFYEGRIAKAIVDVLDSHGGLMRVDDLAAHQSTLVQPISTVYKGYRVWEIPPNGQGMTALIALNILEGVDLKGMGHNTGPYLHHVAESLRLAFADTLQYCCDPTHSSVPLDLLLSKDYAGQRRGLISDDRKIPTRDLQKSYAEFPPGKDTVYFTTSDKDGNACSFIFSNFWGFGSGLVPQGCGFTLQNRGCGFSLDPNHPNVIAPRKRPYHTIIPSMVTDAETDDLLMTYGVMGAFMQPQGHVQVLLNMLEFGLNPQEALDQPRICVGKGHNVFDDVYLETGISEDVASHLQSLGHTSNIVSGMERNMFGRGQIISHGHHWWSGRPATSPVVLWAGSDPRADGQVAGY